MKKVELTKGKLEALTVVLLLAIMSTLMSGCMRRIAIYDNGAVLPIEFFNGFDVHGGANGVDTVDNRRGTVAHTNAARTITVKPRPLPIDEN